MSPTSPARASCWTACRPALPAIRHPQRPHHAPRSWRWPGNGATVSSSSACTAWARPCTRWCAAGTARAAASTRPWAARDLLAYLVRRLLENGANSSFVNQIVDEDIPPEVAATRWRGRWQRAASPRIRRRATCSSRSAKTPRAIDLQDRRARRCWIEAARRLRRHALDGAPPWPTRRAQGAARNPSSTPPTRPTVGHRARGRRGRYRRAIAAARPSRGPPPKRPRAAVLRRKPPISTKNTRPRSSPCSRARPARPCRCRGRGARGGRFPALLRRPRDGLAGASARARRLRLHQPLELPAGHLHRPDRGRAGRGQRRAGQTGRGRRPLIAARATALLHEAGRARTAALQLLPGTARRSARRSASHPDRRRRLHRLHRHGAGDPPRHGRRTWPPTPR
jgi:RHH-type proline utilization regulon transcriptional repressor/proline dehydrogenase/delta 1-pyrroline-5-carboxylate dehydrogenase